MRFEKTGFSCWELIFAIFSKSLSNGTNNICVFWSKGPLKGIEIQIKQIGMATLLHYNGLKITWVPLDVLSTELSMAFSPSNQDFCI